MVHYDKSIIYKLCCKDVNVKGEYVGSTTNTQRRKVQHKHCCNNADGKKYNLNVYTYIREHGGWDAFDLVEVERYTAIDRADLHKRERHWIETLKTELNGNVPTRTSQEWHKEYYESNKEAGVEKVKCECGSVVTKRCLSRHKLSDKHIRLSPPCSPPSLQL